MATNNLFKKFKKVSDERIYLILLIVGIVATIIAPLLLTMPFINKIFNFSETGNIGNTIGGITAPIVGILGAILVYKSFLMQIRANEEMRKENFLKILKEYILQLDEKENGSSIVSNIEIFYEYFSFIENIEKARPRDIESRTAHYQYVLGPLEFALTKVNFVLDKIFSKKINETERLFILLFDIREKLEIMFPAKFINKVNDLTKEAVIQSKILEKKYPDSYNKNLTIRFVAISEKLGKFIPSYNRVIYDCNSL